jgi:hypothetical protein
VTHGCHAERKNGSAASELRCRCAWLHHGSGPWTHRIQGCGAIDPRPKAGSPLIVIPTAPSGPSCSKLSRYGLARAKHVERLVQRPTLTAPARDGLALLRVGTKKRAFRSNKETDETCVALPNPLTKETPYKGHPPVLTSPNPLSTLHRRFACARLSQPCLPESCPGVSATLTTTAFDDSSLRGLEIST